MADSVSYNQLKTQIWQQCKNDGVIDDIKAEFRAEIVKRLRGGPPKRKIEMEDEDRFILSLFFHVLNSQGLFRTESILSSESGFKKSSIMSLEVARHVCDTLFREPSDIKSPVLKLLFESFQNRTKLCEEYTQTNMDDTTNIYLESKIQNVQSTWKSLREGVNMEREQSMSERMIIMENDFQKRLDNEVKIQMEEYQRVEKEKIQSAERLRYERMLTKAKEQLQQEWNERRDGLEATYASKNRDLIQRDRDVEEKLSDLRNARLQFTDARRQQIQTDRRTEERQKEILLTKEKMLDQAHRKLDLEKNDIMEKAKEIEQKAWRAVESWRRDCESNLKMKEDELTRLENDLQASKEALSREQSEVTVRSRALEKDCEHRSNEKQRLDDAVRQAEEMELEVANLRIQLSQKQKLLTSSEFSISEMEGNQKEMRKSINSLQEEISQLRIQLSEKESELRIAISQKEITENALKEDGDVRLKTITSNHETYQRDMETRLQKLSHDAEVEKTRLTNEIEEFKKQKKQLNDQNNELREELSLSNAKSSKLRRDLDASMYAMKMSSEKIMAAAIQKQKAAARLNTSSFNPPSMFPVQMKNMGSTGIPNFQLPTFQTPPQIPTGQQLKQQQPQQSPLQQQQQQQQHPQTFTSMAPSSLVSSNVDSIMQRALHASLSPKTTSAQRNHSIIQHQVPISQKQNQPQFQQFSGLSPSRQGEFSGNQQQQHAAPAQQQQHPAQYPAQYPAQQHTIQQQQLEQKSGEISNSNNKDLINESLLEISTSVDGDMINAAAAAALSAPLTSTSQIQQPTSKAPEKAPQFQNLLAKPTSESSSTSGFQNLLSKPQITSTTPTTTVPTPNGFQNLLSKPSQPVQSEPISRPQTPSFQNLLAPKQNGQHQEQQQQLEPTTKPSPSPMFQNLLAPKQNVQQQQPELSTKPSPVFQNLLSKPKSASEQAVETTKSSSTPAFQNLLSKPTSSTTTTGFQSLLSKPNVGNTSATNQADKQPPISSSSATTTNTTSAFQNLLAKPTSVKEEPKSAGGSVFKSLLSSAPAKISSTPSPPPVQETPKRNEPRLSLDGSPSTINSSYNSETNASLGASFSDEDWF